MHESMQFRLRESQWQPGPGVTDHDGNPLPADRDFAAPPPPEIGPVLSAWSTVSSTKAVWPMWLLAARCLAIGGAIVLALELFAWWQWPGARAVRERYAIQGIGRVVGSVAVVILAMATRWIERCTFVGRDGVAEFTHTSGRVRRRLMRFADVADLKVRLVDLYNHGFYAGSRHDHAWHDAAGNVLLRLRGSYYRTRKRLQSGLRYHYAQAAERAWTDHLVQRLEAEIARGGSAKFVVDRRPYTFDGGRTIAVGNGFVEIINGKKTDRINRDRLRSALVEGGTFKVRTTDARLIGWKGKHDFAYAGIANALAMVILIQRNVLDRAPAAVRPAA